MAESDLPADIFNNRFFGRQCSPAPGADVEFTRFAHLPRELRLQIWAWHLPRRRFLRVLLEEQQGGSEPEPEALPSQLGSGPSHDLGDDDEWASLLAARPSETEKWPSASPAAPPLRVTFLGAPSPAMPALRLVCREARDAHNSVYRIRLPALARIPFGDGARGYRTARIVAHLNPELDILSLHAQDPPEIATLNLLPLFLHHLLQHDFSPGPLRLGVRHLCLDLRHLGSDYDQGAGDARQNETPAQLAPHVLASVHLIVSNLRSLYLRLTTSHPEPRVMSGLANMRSAPWYNSSVPVLPAAPWGFSGHVEPARGGDPRLARPEGLADLRQVWIGNELRPSLDVWAGLESAWGVPAASGARGTRVRALVGMDAEGWAGQMGCDGVGGGSSSLGAYLREERATWRSLMDPGSEMGAILRECFLNVQRTFLPGHDGGDGPPAVAPEEWISRRQPHTAVGFWLIDPEVLEGAEITGYVGGKIVDLSKRGAEGIELWLFRGHP